MKKHKWRYAGTQAKEQLGPDPLVHLSAERKLIKSNAVREVWRAGSFYFKIDKRHRSFRREFCRAAALLKRGIPVVEHLACGSYPEGSCLITRSLENAVTVEQYFASRTPDDDFLNALTDFLKLMIYRKVVHRDLHCGNILYVEQNNFFSLVDVRDAFPARWYNFFLSSSYPMRKLTAELAGLLPEEEVCRLLRKLDVKEPQSFLTRVLERKAAAISGEWPRRRQQVLSGYPKFTRREDDLLFAAGVSREELDGAEKIPADAGVFAAAFYFDLVRIPHRRVLAWSEKEQCLWAEPLTETDTNSALVAEHRSRALLFGVSTSCSDWQNDAAGRIKLSSWKGM